MLKNKEQRVQCHRWWHQSRSSLAWPDPVEGEVPGCVYSWLLSPLRPAVVRSKASGSPVQRGIDLPVCQDCGVCFAPPCEGCCGSPAGSQPSADSSANGLGSLRGLQPCRGFAGGQYLPWVGDLAWLLAPK